MGRGSGFARWLRLAGLALALGIGAVAGAAEEGDAFLDETGVAEEIDLDELNRQIESLIPSAQGFGGVSEINETMAQTGAPMLQELIVHSRDEALRNGVQPMPAEIRRQLTGFLPERVLEAARYRVQGGDDFTLQWNLIRYGEAEAIALDYVVIFKEASDALHNPSLWAHELTHVDQYQRWGVQEFSVRYLRNYEVVEREAYAAETRYAAWRRQHGRERPADAGQPAAAGAASRPVQPAPPPPAAVETSSTCGTAVATCRVTGSGPVGTPCRCNLPTGAVAGTLVAEPAGDAAAPPANACSSAHGTCPLDGEIGVGAACSCVTAQGRFPGTAQQRSLNDRCVTSVGSCPLAAPLLSGEPCYCPGPAGEVEGRVP